MVSGKTRRIVIVTAAAVVALLILAALALHLAASIIKDHVVGILGPQGHAQLIEVGFSSIDLSGVEIGAPPGWPAPYTLRAKHIHVVPDFRALLSQRVVIHKVVVDDVRLPIYRSKDGRLHLLPNLHTGRPDAAPPASDAAPREKKEIDVGGVDFRGGVLEFYDATVAQPPHRLDIEQLQASIGRLHYPRWQERTDVSITGRIAGPSHAGATEVKGWFVVANKDSELHTAFSGVDVAVLSPYLDKSAKQSLTSGTVDLRLDSTVRNNHLRAPGRLTLRDIKVAQGEGALDTFMSIPRAALLRAMEDHNGTVTLDFELDGNLDDPKFSLDENIATRLAAGLAQALGVSVGGVAKGLGETAKGLGSALKGLIGR